MSTNILDYDLFSGRTIQLDCGLRIKQYSIDYINTVGIGYENYEYMIWMLTRYAYEFKFELEDIGLDHEDLNSYDAFSLLSKGLDANLLVEYANFLFDDSFVIKDGYLVSKLGRIDENSIEEVKKTFCKMMFFGKPKERRPANKEAKALIKKQLKMRKGKKVKYDLYSIMYALVTSPNCSETYDTMIRRTPHQIYAEYSHTKQNKDFDNTMHGIYSGVINSSDVRFAEINWINKIEQ